MVQNFMVKLRLDVIRPRVYPFRADTVAAAVKTNRDAS